MTTKKQSKLDRGAGLLMAISSLPSPYGIGTLGKEAYEFADFAKKTGARYWQVLPIGPTSYGDSPYQAFSAFAGNPYFIDLDTLIKEGLLTNEDVTGVYWGTNPSYVDYPAIFNGRFVVLKKAYARFKDTIANDKAFEAFEKANSYWLKDYALFMAVKNHFDGKAWSDWDDDIRLRKATAVKKYETLLSDDILFWEFIQFKFDSQWNAWKKYTNDLGIDIIGDIPLYVSMDSADVWVHPEIFELDEDLKNINIAGVPPDLFSETGQRWGNPLYRWDVIEKSDFEWWRERMKSCGYHYDVVRIDHFIGIVNYWSIPADCETAIDGKWIPGPGSKLTDMINRVIPDTKIIAEDLGVLTAPVSELIEANGYPGMKILEFALDANPKNEYLPHNYSSDNSIVYLGTHDNETLMGALKGLDDWDINKLYVYYNANSRETLAHMMIRAAYESVARVAILQVQDLLFLGNEARMNFPSTLGQNWQWRVTKEQLNIINTQYYHELAKLFNRAD